MRKLRKIQHPHQENPENLLKKANKASQRIQRRTTERKEKNLRPHQRRSQQNRQNQTSGGTKENQKLSSKTRHGIGYPVRPTISTKAPVRSMLDPEKRISLDLAAH